MSQHDDDTTDHYTTLGAGEDATREEIERLYKRLARRHHPDRGGDEERMKTLNEAYRVLGNAAEREAYDAARRSGREAARQYDFTPRRSPSAQADVLGGRLFGAWLCVLSGLVLLFLVRFHYVRFLWPLALLAGAVVLAGVLMAYGALRFARAQARPRWLFGRLVWAQELAFWSTVCAGVYGVYRLLTAI
jgi:hypothetical protein